MQYPLNSPVDHHIGNTLQKMKDPYWVPVYLPQANKIIINTAWHIPRQIPLQLAHEIGHALNGDSEVEYHACFASESVVERAATRRGLDILVPYCFDDVDPNYVSYVDFMDRFAIPDHYTGDVIDKIRRFYA